MINSEWRTLTNGVLWNYEKDPYNMSRTYSGKVSVADGAIIGSRVHVSTGVYIGFDSSILKDTVIQPYARLPWGRRDISDNMVLKEVCGKLWRLTAVRCADGLILTTGIYNQCQGLGLEEMREALARNHEGSTMFDSALKQIETWYASLN